MHHHQKRIQERVHQRLHLVQMIQQYQMKPLLIHQIQKFQQNQMIQHSL
jgi:hypothetical protein